MTVNDFKNSGCENGRLSFQATCAILMLVFLFFDKSISAGQGVPAKSQPVKIAVFDVDATPPLGSEMAYDPVKRIGELALRCRGIVILGSDQPIVICAVDWIGIANEGHDAFRRALANAAGTTIDRVAVHTLHQHDAPGCDFTAERIVRELGLGKLGRFDGTFHRVVIERAATAVRLALPTAQVVTHYGWGVADVSQVASNRRIMGPDGRVRAVRYTTTKDPALRAEPEGVIDPQLSLLSFWIVKPSNDGQPAAEQPVALLSYYACHPQSYYRTGIPSPDFPGIARFVRGQSLPEALLVHFNGAGGNIGAGKYNDGAKENRMTLALRLADGMKQALDATEKFPLDNAEIGWQNTPVKLPAAAHLDRSKLVEAIKTEPVAGYIDKADQLAWLQRCEEGHEIEIACLRVGNARVLQMPGELFVEYQLAAKAMRPDLKVAMAAYGDYGPGYIGTKIAYSEGGYETSPRASNVSPDAEQVLTDAMLRLLRKTDDDSQTEDDSQTDDDSQSQQQEAPPENSGSAKKKSARQPLEPEQALRSFEVPAGFEMQLVASEPNVIEPIVISYDENGKLYVAEFLKFPAHGGKSDGPDGRIRLLQDLDENGFYETSSVFADGFAWPTGICQWKGGVFVISAPDLWYLKDSDGDGQADVRQKILTGFGFTTEEGTANNLIWGLDHWIYGAGSNSGGEIRPADQPSAPPISIRGHDFRFHPATGRFEAISGSEQFGNAFDDWGNRFICQNSKPAVHVVLPARYLARNPYLPVASVRNEIWKGDQVYRISPPENWRVARTGLRKSQDRKWAASYVEHDVFTACTGVTIYRCDQFPASFCGNLFVGDVQSNLVHRRILQPAGPTFVSLRADEKTEFVRSTDNWFRPVNLCNGPEGTLQIVDMYREVIETPDSLPEEILASLNLANGHDRGRIYRLAPIGFKAPKLPRLGSASVAQLVQELSSPNGWRRETASRLIDERQDPASAQLLRQLLRETNSELAQLHALYGLMGLEALHAEDLLLALASSSAGLREHAVQLAEPILDAGSKNHRIESANTVAKSQGGTGELLLNEVISMANDPSPRVRFQVALTLGEIDDPRAGVALANIARRDADDTWIRTAVLSSSLKHAAGMLESLIADAGFVKTTSGPEILKQLSVVVGGRNRPEEIKKILSLVEREATEFPGLGQWIVLGLGEGLRRSRSSLDPYVAQSSTTAALLSKLIDNSQRALGDATSSISQRVDAIATLAHGRFQDVNQLLAESLTSHRPRKSNWPLWVRWRVFWTPPFQLR